jgi:hypothetical protein
MAMTRLLLVVAILACAATASAQTSSFTYQGRLTNSSTPASGTFTIKFDLYDAAAGGNLLGTDTQSVSVTNGVFTVTLDFGAAAFDGSARFLEITVAGTTLSPRNPISSTPYAIQASNSSKLGGVDANQHVITTDPRLSDSRPASSINLNTATVTGVLPIASGGTGSSTQNFVDLSTAQIVAGAKTFSNSSNVFSGNGAGLTNITPANISGGTANININGISAKAATATSGTTPSVADLTLLVLNYASNTTVTNLTGGIDGQCVVLVALTNRVTISDSGNFRLSKNWTPYGDDTLTLCRSAASGSPIWYERARSEQGLSLTVARSGNGAGTVTSNVAGIDCGSDCQETFGSGTVVQLTATPDATSTFAGWSGACTGTSTCSVTMDAVKSVSATFQRNSYSLLVTRTAGGTVTSSPAGIYCGVQCAAALDAGTAVTLSAHVDTSATFSGWAGACSGASSTCVVTMSSAKSVTARFTFPLTVTKSGTGAGTVTSDTPGINCGATCTAPFDGGSLVQLTATPSSTSTFAGWSGACTGTGSCIVTMDNARNVNATFTLNTFNLTVTKLGTAGSVTSNPAGINCGATCQAAYTSGTTVELTATAPTGGAFAGWAGCDSVSGTTCFVTMNGNKGVAANFTFPLTATRSGSGAGTITSNPAGINCGVDCSESYRDGTSVELTASADSSSVFTGWSGACTGMGSCQVTMDAAKNVTATFEVSTFTLAVSKNGTGSGTVTSNPAGINCGGVCSAEYNSGTVVQLTASPAAGSSFVGWSGGGCSGTGTCTVTMSASASVTASFAINTFVLTVTRSGSGSGTVTSNPSGIDCGVDCSESYNFNTIVQLTATPGTGSTFLGWSGACTGTGSCSVTMSAARNVTATFDNPAPTIINVTSTTANGAYNGATVIPIQVTFSEIVNVTGSPTLALNSGGVAVYASGGGTNTLTFNYSVGVGQNTPDLDYSSASALSTGGGTIRDIGSANAVLTLPSPGSTGSLGANKSIIIDTANPFVTNVTSTTPDGTYSAGDVINVQVVFNEAVFVTGSPRIQLNIPGSVYANYAGGTGTNTLNFSYTVLATHNSADLDYASTTAFTLNGGALRDQAFNPSPLTLPPPGAAGSLGANKNIVITPL